MCFVAAMKRGLGILKEPPRAIRGSLFAVKRSLKAAFVHWIRAFYFFRKAWSSRIGYETQ